MQGSWGEGQWPIVIGTAHNPIPANELWTRFQESPLLRRRKEDVACTSLPGPCQIATWCLELMWPSCYQSAILKTKKESRTESAQRKTCHPNILHMDLMPLWISYDVRLQFHCSLILLEGEYSVTCSWMLPYPSHPSNRTPKVEDSYFSSWFVFSQAKNSRDIRHQPVIVLFTIVKLYHGYYWFYLKRNAKKKKKHKTILHNHYLLRYSSIYWKA